MPSNNDDHDQTVEVSRMERLAPEIRAHICQKTPLSDLKALALTCSAWHDSCEPRLWRSIDAWTAVHDHAKRDGNSRVALLKSLIRRPKRSQYVRSLTIGSWVVEASPTDAILRAVAPTLEKLHIPHARCSRPFRFEVGCVDSYHNTTSIVGIDFPRVREFQWGMSLARLAEVGHVLSSMPSLERLTLCGLGSGAGVIRESDRIHVDRAATALGQWAAGGKEVPERSKEIYNEKRVAPTSTGAAVPRPSFPHLTYLAIRSSDRISDFVARTIINGAPSLQSLALHCDAIDDEDVAPTVGSDGNGDPDRLAHGESLGQRVGRLPQLRELSLSGADGLLAIGRNDDVERDARQFEALEWLMTERKVCLTGPETQRRRCSDVCT